MDRFISVAKQEILRLGSTFSGQWKTVVHTDVCNYVCTVYVICI